LQAAPPATARACGRAPRRGQRVDGRAEHVGARLALGSSTRATRRPQKYDHADITASVLTPVRIRSESPTNSSAHRPTPGPPCRHSARANGRVADHQIRAPANAQGLAPVNGRLGLLWREIPSTQAPAGWCGSRRGKRWSTCGPAASCSAWLTAPAVVRRPGCCDDDLDLALAACLQGCRRPAHRDGAAGPLPRSRPPSTLGPARR